MGYEFTVELDSFDALPRAQRCALVLGHVRTLVDTDRAYLLAHPETPSLYLSGVVYRPQQTSGGVHVGMDLWWDIPKILGAGEGSCEDLAAWRVAELQVRGRTLRDRRARPYVHSKDLSDGMTLYHVVVHYPDEEEEDPSVQLGMWPPWTG